MDKKQILNDLTNHLSSYKIVEPLALVGSGAKNENFNDLDLLLIVSEISDTKSKIVNCFKDYNTVIVDDAIKITDFCNCEISIAIYSLSETNKLIEDFLSGKKASYDHRTWAIGYWLCESFISDLGQVIILNDKDNYLNKLKLLLGKFSKYGKERILLDCIEELEIKKVLLEKTPINSIEQGFIKNDLILALIRGIYTCNNEYLRGFKRIEFLIENCDENYKPLLLKFINNNDTEALDTILNYFKKHTKWNNKVYFGTWQFSGDFKKLSDEYIRCLILNAKSKGINRFDTALVYGNGRVEQILSSVLSENDIVLTKVPAKVKPEKYTDKPLGDFYDYDYIKSCILKSLVNLRRDFIDIVLLHNWTKKWEEYPELIEWLLQLKSEGLINQIGISLPNDFNNELSDEVLEKIDVVEAPFNPDNIWIKDNIDKYKKYGVEIILRSLFIQGKLLKEKKQSYENIIKEVKAFNTSVVIGMTTEEQIDNNIRVLRR